MSSIRPAAVAGMFYPGDARTLAAEVDELLGGVGVPAPRLGYPKALIGSSQRAAACVAWSCSARRTASR